MNDSPEPQSPVNPTLVRAAAYGWRLLVVAALVGLVIWILGQLLVVVVPVFIAVMVARVLEPLAARLRRRGLSAGLAALAVFASALALVAGGLVLIVPAMVDEFSGLGPTLSSATDDVEDWIVEESPIDVTREEVADFRQEATDRIGDYVGSSGVLQSRAGLLIEIPTGALLAFFLTFFAVKDGASTVASVGRRLPEGRRRRLTVVAGSAWETLGGYLRGAAILGAVEALIIGVAVWLTGGALVVPVMVLTFCAAFVPIIGAVVAGVVAVLVALVGGGPTAAVIVAVVALVVQQLDNDLLAPVIYGRSLQLHPVVILVSIVAGGALFGIVGTLVAVPVVAVALNVWTADRADRTEEPRADESRTADTRTADTPTAEGPPAE